MEVGLRQGKQQEVVKGLKEMSGYLEIVGLYWIRLRKQMRVLKGGRGL